MHNSPQLWHFRVVRSSNLTFGGYLVGTTPMLSVRSSLFVVWVLFRACKGCVAHWWFFDIISWGRLWGTTATYKPYRFPDKELHGTYLFDGNYHQQSSQRTVTYCLGEASPNSHSSSGTPHQAKSWLRGTVVPEEHRRSVLKAHEQDVRTVDCEKCIGLCWRHVGE